MDNEITMTFADRFKKATELRFPDESIDWKPTRFKDRRTGEMKEGTPLAYLNWAVAWQAFLEIYPDGKVEVVEQADGNPLWNVNGYGMLKVKISACGQTHIETFPIMQGGQNDAMPIESIDGRDVNDSLQRAFTKAIARFGIGLYIYKGELKPSSDKSKPKVRETKREQKKSDVPFGSDTDDIELKEEKPDNEYSYLKPTEEPLKESEEEKKTKLAANIMVYVVGKRMSEDNIAKIKARIEAIGGHSNLPKLPLDQLNAILEWCVRHSIEGGEE